MTTNPADLFPHLVRDGLDPIRAIQELRDDPATGGVRRVPGLGGGSAWIVTRYELVRAVLADPATYSSAPADDPSLPRPGGNGGPALSMLTSDPPDHTRLRRMLSREFTVRRIRALEPRITEIVETCLDDMAAAGPPADLVTAFALPVPSMVICELIGVPYADRDQFQRRTARQVLGVPDRAEVARIAAESREYMTALAERALAGPGDDILGAIVRNHGDGVSRAELAELADLLLFAGHETTASMLGIGTLALLQHPDQLRRVRDAPDAVKPAVEELLRYCSVLQMTIPRTATCDTELAGHRIARGDQVMVSLPVANRDPTFVGNGDTFDVGRPPSPHVAFGYGIHHCLGAGLARAEMAIAFPALLRRFPDLALATSAVRYRVPGVFHGVEALVVEW
ncbi:cytochrome P450 [Pseudonocardia sp. TRM90224]|uniref:cytochrome P450 n=1 Tax=Pseudonocardia sp. TRM90224 TaxID=2812678 RepID=UPI001E52559A|nr:cytochrome P450 [Pseudonocardia sp. TRM90224]